MGGYRSGRWQAHSKATPVEDCRALDLGLLARDGAFRPWHSGTLRWLRGERELAAIGYTVRPGEDGLALVLAYRGTWGKEPESVELVVPLEALPMRFGGVRWWGRCPLVVNGRSCRRRVGKLYLPPGGRYFGCRVCYALTYESAQEHDPRVSALRRDQVALARLMGNLKTASVAQLGLALKVLSPRKGTP